MSTTPTWGPAAPQTPLFLKVLICFLLIDGGERIVQLVLWAKSLPEVPSLAPSPYYPNLPAEILWILVHMLLAILLFLRTWWGRIWTQAIFIIHIFFVAHAMAIRHPEIWIYMDWSGRVRLLVTLVLDIVVVTYLWSRQARTHLSR